jgi:hypothetical protein
MAFGLARKAPEHRPGAAYLPMFAMMNPRAYAAWKRPEDRRQIRRAFFEPWDRR